MDKKKFILCKPWLHMSTSDLGLCKLSAFLCSNILAAVLQCSSLNIVAFKGVLTKTGKTDETLQFYSEDVATPINFACLRRVCCIVDGLSARGGLTRAGAVTSNSPRRRHGARVPVLFLISTSRFILLCPVYRSADALPQPRVLFATGGVHTGSGNQRGR